jgi:single-strand selective monofunctional uracil DNA glycosylase
MQELIRIADELSAAMEKLSFSDPVAHVYNPLEYARRPAHRYLERFGGLGARVMLIGMNPGPWGMAQTGVPFGAVSRVRDWLDIDEPVSKPPEEHPKRPVTGLDCTREEVSGARLWGWAEERFGTPERFFKRFFVANYCPLLFLEESARNVTPDKLVAAERDAVQAPCDKALRATAEALGVSHAIGVGAWAEKRARIALDGLDVRYGRILHPSPASPAANKDWAGKATAQLEEMGVKV